MIASAAETSSLSLKFGHQHTHLNTALTFSSYINSGKVSDIRKQLSDACARDIPQTFIVWKTQCAGDGSSLEKYLFEKVLNQMPSFSQTKKFTVKSGEYFYLVLEGPASPQVSQVGNQQDPFLWGSIKVDDSTASDGNPTLFNNSRFDVNFKKGDSVLAFITSILLNCGLAGVEKHFSNSYKLFKQLNLQLNFGSMNSLSGQTLVEANRLLSTEKSEFDYSTIDQNGQIMLVTGSLLSVQMDCKNKYLPQLWKSINNLKEK